MKLKSKIKILVYLPRLGGGGAEKHAVRTLNNFDRSKFDIRIAVTRTGSYESMLSDNIEVIHLLKRDIESSTARMILSVGPLKKLIKKWKPDILYTLLNNATISAYLATRNLPENERPGIIVSVQNNLTMELSNLSLVHTYLYRKFLPLAYQSSDKLVAISNGVRRDLVNNYPFTSKKTITIFNAGYDREIELFIRDKIEEEKPGNGFLCVACGRLTQQKNYPMMLSAIKRVVETIPEVYLWILGDGEEASELSAMVTELGLSKNVRFLGFKNNPYAYFKEADLFLLSSSWEGFGNVLVEALATGTPVVSTNCPFGPDEIVMPQENGVLVEDGDVNGFATAIIELIRDPQKLDMLAAGAKDSVLKFRDDQIAREYEEAFMEVIYANN